MTWEDIGENGSYCIKTVEFPEGEGRNKVLELLRRVVEGFAEGSRQYWQHDEDDFPFIYAERQLVTVVLPVLTGNDAHVLVEQPITRKGKRAPSESDSPSGGHGWMDYWVEYRDLVVLLELKHAWISRKAVATTYTKNSWAECLLQLSSAGKHGIKEYIEPNQACWVVGIIVAVHWNGAQEVLPDDEPTIWEAHEKVRNELEKISNQKHWPLNWSGCWRLPADMTTTWESDNEPKRRYPAVSFYASAKKVQ